jgi:hypothetical protein
MLIVNTSGMPKDKLPRIRFVLIELEQKDKNTRKKISVADLHHC